MKSILDALCDVVLIMFSINSHKDKLWKRLIEYRLENIPIPYWMQDDFERLNVLQNKIEQLLKGHPWS